MNWDGSVGVYIGWFKEGRRHGYGKREERGAVQEGVYNHQYFMKVEDYEHIKDFDPLKDKIAQKVDFKKYLVDAK